MKLTPAAMLNKDEIQRMIEAAGNPQNRFLVSLLFDSFLRLTELINLTWKDILIENSGIVVSIAGITGDSRKIWCMNSKGHCLDWKNEYLLDPNGEGLVFVSSCGKPLTYHALKARINRIVRRAGIEKNVSPSLCRNSGIIDLLRRGIPETAIRMQGWGNSITTMLVSYIEPLNRGTLQ